MAIDGAIFHGISPHRRDKAKSVGARKFVVRRLLSITHIFGAPALIAHGATRWLARTNKQ